MPELPEVETYKRYFDATSLHKGITRVDVRSTDILEETQVQELSARLEGRSLQRRADMESGSLYTLAMMVGWSCISGGARHHERRVEWIAGEMRAKRQFSLHL
jgi:hypothetical protein